MTANDFALLLLQLTVMLLVGLAGGAVLRRWGQPAVLGEMLSGILLGPTLLGWVSPGAFAALFPAGDATDLVRGAVIKLGMLFFLFLVGLEISLAQVRRFGLRAMTIGALGALAPLACGMGAVYALPNLWGPQAEQNRLMFALFIGAAMANTANPVLARILIDLKLMKQDIGAMLMTASIVDDVIGWSLLGVVLSQFSPPEVAAPTSHLWQLASVVLFFVGTIIAGRWIGAPLVRWATNRLRLRSSGTIGLVAALVLVSAAVAEQAHLHAFLGPFLIGIGLSVTTHELHEAYEAINRFVAGLFVPIYFVSMGLTANFVRSFDLALVAVVVGVACVSKLASVYAASRIAGFGQRAALGIGFGMNARGAIGIILAALGREHGVINEPVYVALVLMAVLTSLVSAPAMKHLMPNDPFAKPRSPGGARRRMATDIAAAEPIEVTG